ncbi:MAG: hypothetical protein EXR62_00600 [Chloroflexi bacterium]|nr:hypothetical protein [Chloroflexota bacterium]
MVECDHCKAQVQAGEVFCTRCGRALSYGAMHLDRSILQRQPGWVWLAGVSGVALLCLLFILALTMAAVYEGMAERSMASTAAAGYYAQQAAAFQQQGRLEWALAAIEEALKYAPEDRHLLEQRSQVQQQLQTQTVQDNKAKGPELAVRLTEAQQEYNDGNWAATIATLDPLRANMSAEDEAGQLLFGAYYNQGLQQLAADQVAEALGSFEKAYALNPDNPNAAGEMRLVYLYLAGVKAVAEKSWTEAISNLRQLYQLFPEYRDVQIQLQDAYFQVGDQYSSEEEWCFAADVYTLGVEVRSNSRITSKRDLARARCQALNTPPRLTPTPALASSDYHFMVKMGLVYPIIKDQIHIRGRVVTADEKPIPGVEVVLSAVDWSVQEVTDKNGLFAFDGLKNPGIYRLSLPNMAVDAVQVAAEWGKQVQVEFVEVP